MRQSVLETFPGFTRDLEGACSWLYLDKLGIPTTAYGNALFSTAAMCALPWRHSDGAFASRDEMIAEYSAILNLKDKRNPYGVLWTDCGGGAFQALTRLHLDGEGVAALVRSTIAKDDLYLQKKFPDYETWPACAQLAVHSLEWACGDAYSFPKMDAALRDRDFATAALQIEMTKEHNPGNDLTRRNEANRILMLNAQRVDAYHLDPDLLNWTSLLGVSDAETLPDLSKYDSVPPGELVQLHTPIMGQETSASLPTCWPAPKPPDEPA